VGYHLDQARAYRLALAPEDDHSRALALRAGHRLAAAGTRALDRSELSTAARLLERAERLLVDDPPARFTTLLTLIEATGSLQEGSLTLSASEAAAAIAPSLGDLAVLRAQIATWMGLTFADPSFTPSDHADEVEAAAATFEAAGDIDGLMDADLYRVSVALNQALWRDVIRSAETCLTHARGHGRGRLVQRMSAMTSNAYCWGSHPVDEGLRSIDRLMQETTSRTTLLFHGTARAVLLAYAGDRNGVEAAWAEARRLADEVGVPMMIADQRRSVVDRHLGNHEASLAAARRASAYYAAHGETGNRSTAVGFAGQACLELDDLDGADAHAEEGRVLAAEDDAASQVLWRSIRAVVLARRGDHAAADVLSAEAVERAQRTDGTIIGESLRYRAECLALAGHNEASAAAARASYDFWARKGCVNGMRWAERWMTPASRAAG
jgi:hypothetical protein